MSTAHLSVFLVVFAEATVAGVPSMAAGASDAPTRRTELAIINDYVLQVGDVLEIKFFFTPELNQVVPVRPDGKISLQLTEEIQVSGMTPAQVGKVLVQKYSPYLKKPEVAVIVKDFGGQSVYVGGEVASPRLVPLRGSLTALQAIFSTGGFRPSAQTSNVLIISKGEDGLPVARKVNLKKAMSGRDPKEDPLLQSYDVVFVPKSSIGKVNTFVDQYVNNMIPRSLLFSGFSYVLYRGQQTSDVPVPTR